VPQIQQGDFIAQQQRGADLRGGDGGGGHDRIPGAGQSFAASRRSRDDLPELPARSKAAGASQIVAAELAAASVTLGWKVGAPVTGPNFKRSSGI
jgi:hypothetical protein